MTTISNNSKELIKNRMLKHALSFWNIKHAEDLDPVVKLIMEALSTELYNLSNEIRDTEVRVLEKISNLLAPDFLTCPNTAHALMTAPPIEAVDILDSTAHFFTAGKRSGDDPNEKAPDVFFTAVDSLKVFDAKVAYIATATNLFEFDENNNKMIVAHPVKTQYNENRFMWLGIDINEKISDLNGMSFCFDWKNPVPQLTQENYQLLPLSKWTIDGQELHTMPGLQYESTNASSQAERNIFLDYNLLSLMESDVKNFYDRRFMTLSRNKLNITAQLKETYPAEFPDLFPQPELKRLSKPLLWIKVIFPMAMPQDSLDTVGVHLNCVPVMNRQLCDMKYRLKGGSNIVPLKTAGAEQFLSVKSLSDEIHEYQATPYRKLEEETTGTYTLRSGGVERFDVRNAREYISYLLELLRSESAAFSVYGYDFIATLLREMNQRIALMEQKTMGLAATASEVPHYIIVKPFEGQDLLYAEYWITLAEGGNHIRSGTRLQQVRSAKIKENGLYLVTSTIGGKNRLKPEERLNAFRYGLITRNRIVTKEDIRNFCHYELGERISGLSIKKGIEMSPNPMHGFSRTIDIHLIPSTKEKLDAVEWQLLSDQLRTKLSARSGMSNNYRILVDNML